MTHPNLITTELAGLLGQPLLLVGPSLGTTAAALWRPCAQLLGNRFHVVGWDLPGHGQSPPTTCDLTIASLARALLSIGDRLSSDAPVHCAGGSVGGCVGLQLAVDAPQRVATITALAAAPRISTRQAWLERAQLVRRSGTAALLDTAPKRWFAPGFAKGDPSAVSLLLRGLLDVDSLSYAAICEALGEFDIGPELAAISCPVLAIGGAEDIATPPDEVALITNQVADGRLIVLSGVGHLPPIEAPEDVARLILSHAGAVHV